MAHQTRKYSRLKNFIQEVKFIYNIYKMYLIFFKNIFNFKIFIYFSKYIQELSFLYLMLFL